MTATQPNIVQRAHGQTGDNSASEMAAQVT
jgi:hypothetical protein